jgi:hypothetical protein
MRENLRGMQQIRGLDGQPAAVKALGANRYTYEPGVYGEFTPISETEMTTRRQYGALAGTVTIDDLVAEKHRQLASRQVTRIRYNIWTLLATGVLSVLGEGGVLLYKGQFDVKTFTATTPWGTTATATPLGDMRSMQETNEAGTSCSFGTGAVAYMNRHTANQLLANTNGNDFGAPLAKVGTIPGLADANRIFAGQGLPTIEVMNDGYLDDTGTWKTYIPDSKVIVVGQRPNGDPLGEYLMTRNASNENAAPGSYVYVWDSLRQNGGRPPRHIEVHYGHNGGPVIYYPNGVCVMTV